MKIDNNYIPNSQLSMFKKMTGETLNRKGNHPTGKVVEIVKTRMENEAVALELSEEGVHRLKIRNIYKTEMIQARIDEKLEMIAQKLDFLTEVEKSIDEMYNIVNEFMENFRQEIEAANKEETSSEELVEQEGIIASENHNISEELRAEAKNIEKIMKDLADMIEAIEKMKAQREGTEYQAAGSLAEEFRNTDFIKNGLHGIRLLDQAKGLIQEEINALYREIAEMKNQINDYLGITDKSKNDKITQPNLVEILEFINNTLNNDKQ